MTTMVRAALALFGSLSTAFFASNYDWGLLLAAAFWSGLGLLVLVGALPKAPKRNAILVIPATALAALYWYHQSLDRIVYLPWYAIIPALVLAALGSYYFLERRSLEAA